MVTQHVQNIKTFLANELPNEVSVDSFQREKSSCYGSKVPTLSRGSADTSGAIHDLLT